MDTCTQNFRVGTEWIARENGNHPNFHIIGGDFGNSANKTWGPHGMSRFPGYAVRMGRSAQVLSPRPSTIQIEDLDAGVRWLVGEQAQEQLSARDKSVSAPRRSLPLTFPVVPTVSDAVPVFPGADAPPSAPPSETRGNSINASSSRRHSRTTRCGKTGPSTGTSFPDVSAFV